MSFSGDVKEELSRQISSSRHCQLAELAAIFGMNGKITVNDSHQTVLQISTENVALARKCYKLIKEAFQIQTELDIRPFHALGKNHSYVIMVEEQAEVERMLHAFKLIDDKGQPVTDVAIVNRQLILHECCKRAFLRGCFLASGSMSDPEKFYHFEIVCDTMKEAMQLCNIMGSFEMDAKIVERKHHFVVYLKEGTQIVDMLNVMEAHVSLMQMENVRILKDMRNSVNRQVNCETANLNKTVNAAVKQIEDIRLVQEQKGLESLPKTLREVAQIRLENPEASLKELGEMLEPPIGKSGVNHRLRKISEIAEDMRG
jgi:DNA-binding protein WhiA